MAALSGVPEKPPCFRGYPRLDCNDCPPAIKVACLADSPEGDREAFYRAAAMWAEKGGVALVVIAALVALGFVAGVHLALAYMFPWPARMLMLIFVGGGMAFGWALCRFLPWAFRRIVGPYVEPGES